MKKTVTVNLNGRVFTMDEDAYQLLDNYLRNLRIYFRKEEGSSEIVADFEARIEELFSEKVRLGYEVIAIELVEEVISRMGRPDDFEIEDTDKTEEPEKAISRIEDKREEYSETKKKFFRDIDDKMFGGICSGIGAYFGWDVLAVRIIFVILLFATSLWIVPFYLLAWIIFPGAQTAEQKLQMRGRPITVENIGKMVSAEAEQKETKTNKGCLAGFLEFIVGLLKVCLIGLGILIGIPLIFALVIIIIVLFAVIFGVGGGLLGLLPLGFMQDSSFLMVEHPVLATTCFIIILAIPLIALIYTIISHFAKWKPVHSAVKWVSLGVWLIALIVFLFSGFKINRDAWVPGSHQWHWNWDNSTVTLDGNGILSEKEYYITEAVDYVQIGGHLIANLQIEQISGDSTFVLISGDENLIDKVKYDVDGNRLLLSTYDEYRLRPDNNLIVRVQTPGIKGVRSFTVGNVNLNKAIRTEEFSIKIEGAGKVIADSLYTRILDVSTEGVGSVNLAGTANNVKFTVEGAGNINALEMIADSISARVDGIGNIKCNPVEYLKGEVNGIGKITYKNEPKEKNSGVMGMGKIGLE